MAYCAIADGFDVHAFLEDMVGVSVLGGSAYAPVRWLRKVRGIELAELAKPKHGPTE